MSFVHGTLSFFGSADADVFSISGNGYSGVLTMDAQTGTTFVYGKGDITGPASGFELALPVQTIKAKLSDGNEMVIVGGSIHARLDLNLAGNVPVEDDDTVIIGGWESANKGLGGVKIKTGDGNDSAGCTSAKIFGGTKLDLGTGTDQFEAFYRTFAGSLSIKATDGGSASQSGPDGIALFGTQVVRAFAFTVGHEGATLQFSEGTTVGRDVKVAFKGAFATDSANGAANPTPLTWDLWASARVSGSIRLLGANLVVNGPENIGFIPKRFGDAIRLRARRLGLSRRRRLHHC